MTKYAELWDEIKNLIECSSIEKINNKPGEPEKDLMKIKFNSDDNFPLKRILKLHNLTIVVRSIFQECDICHYRYFLEFFKYEPYL